MNPQSKDGAPDPASSKSSPWNSGAAALIPLIVESTKDGIPVETLVQVAGSSAIGGPMGEALASLILELDKRGAAMRVDAIPLGAILRVQGVSPASVHATTNVVVKRLGIFGPLHAVQIQRLAAAPITRGEMELPAGIYLRMNLTKRLLMILLTGGYVVSNCFNGIAEVLGPHDSREATWSRILVHRANGRLFMLHPSQPNGFDEAEGADDDLPF